ncbi:MAG: hypothetical protein MUC87_01970 [Bacteroidia bacterium]|nr:hypothetical protein [Bacteroidia bacterium]
MNSQPIKPENPSHDNFHIVFDEEKKHIDAAPDERLNGIAFSGGGIRSASFGLGVMQALVKGRKMEKMHYMSTVSGGGYLGTALTWALHQLGDKAGTQPKNFPLGDKYAETAATPNPFGNKRLNFIRLHSNYLTPSGSLDLISFFTVVMRSIFMSLFVYMAMFCCIMILLHLSGAFTSTCLAGLIGIDNPGPWLKGYFFPAIILFIALGFFLNVGYSLYTRLGSSESPETKYEWFIRTQRISGFLIKAALLLLLFGLMPMLHSFIREVTDFGNAALAGSTTSFGVAVSIWQYWKAQKQEKSTGMISGITIFLGAFSLIYGLTLVAYSVGFNLVNEKGLLYTLFPGGRNIDATAFALYVALGFFALSVIFGWVVNLNLISPSRIWRNRLMETFMPEEKAVEQNKWHEAMSADVALIEDMCKGDNKRPYHIINTNLILANSQKVKYRSRGGDNFILSPLYCGSGATGWCKTSDTHSKKSRRISLATAMATSAAAVNPNAGVSGEGATRNTIVSVMFIILNIRLGFWTTNPAKKPWWFTPNFFIPGLNGQLLGAGLKETNRNIQLSDGGHFENLAIYEYIRRELSTIVLSDGGADGQFNFDDLANAVEKVRVDFGAQIEFRDQYSLGDLLPDTASSSLFDKKYMLAKRGFAIADITYSSGKKGVLYYIKLTMVNDLPADVYSYKGVHPEFPHQSTADQFFDEKQFEAYRELGYKITHDLLTANDLQGKPLLDV